MRITPIHVVVLASMTLLSGTLAQNQVFPSCAQTLKQSPKTFLKSRPDNASEQEAAALYWAGCKGEQNAQRLRGYPKLAARLERLRDLEIQFIVTQLPSVSMKNRDGIDNTYARIAPILQLHFEALIRLTTSKVGAVTNSAIRTRYAKAKLEIETRIARVIAEPQVYGEPEMNPDSDFEKEKVLAQFRKITMHWKQKTYRKILSLIGSQRNAANLEVLEFLNNSLSANKL
jgi:hypothetical protein